MRELKCKAWHKQERKWYEPTHIGVNGYRAVMSIYTGRTWFTEGHYPDDFELVFYIGRKDKHDNEIYTGNILAYGQNRVLIKDIWTCQWLQTEVEDGEVVTDILDRFHHLQNMTGLEQAEIIGNIYENPDLVPV